MTDSHARDAGEAIRVAFERDLPSRGPLLQRLDRLALGLLERYRRGGSTTDIERAVKTARRALSLTPQDDADRWERSNVLGVGLLDRYELTGDDSDLNEAIRLIKDAGVFNLPISLSVAVHLTNLSLGLYGRYERTRDLADLGESIQTARQAIGAVPHDHQDRTIWVNNLGSSLIELHSRTGADDVLDEAISIMRGVAEITVPDDADHVGLLNNLGAGLVERYEQTRLLVDLEEAIQLARIVVDSTPHNHPDRARWLFNLGSRLDRRHDHTNAGADLEEAILHYMSALHQTSSPTIHRIEAGRNLVTDLATLLRWNEAYEASQITISLVPKLTQRSLKTSDTQHVLAEVMGLACDAAATAFHALAEPFDALMMLETGRAIGATLLDDRRADVSALQEAFPFLATEFLCICKTLEEGVSNDAPWGDVVNKRIEALDEFDEIVRAIRETPGFETFLLLPTARDMIVAAESGPIVVINVSWLRCDAIIVAENGIRSLNLPELHSDDIDEKIRENRLGSPEVLVWLWEVAINPILSTLGFTHKPSTGRWPHVWWIPTGPLVKFPLHAAGHHRQSDSESALDRVVSSYSSSVKAILSTRRLAPLESLLPGSATLVAMEDTPDHSVRLEYANEEITIVRNLCESMGLKCREPNAVKDDVTNSVQGTNIFHFAGHGYTHRSEPSKSYLALQDWRANPLTIADLVTLKLLKSSAFLAYLSACGTGQIRDVRFTDEAVHLISACQIAGFRHVIGTLWEVRDETCVDMARITYEVIRDSAMSDESVSLGLHKAARELRNRWLEASSFCTDRGEDHNPGQATTPTNHEADSRDLVDESRSNNEISRDVLLYDEEHDEGESLQWVPYVHFGP